MYGYQESHVQLLDGSMLSENVACVGAGMCSGLGCRRLILRPPPPAYPLPLFFLLTQQPLH